MLIFSYAWCIVYGERGVIMKVRPLAVQAGGLSPGELRIIFTVYPLILFPSVL